MHWVSSAYKRCHNNVLTLVKNRNKGSGAPHLSRPDKWWFRPLIGEKQDDERRLEDLEV